MITVTGAVNLLRDYSSHDFLRDLGETLGEDNERKLVHLLVEQIEFADVVVLNKAADATPHHVETTRQIIRSLNADTKFIETSHSDVPADEIRNTGLFGFVAVLFRSLSSTVCYEGDIEWQRDTQTSFSVMQCAPDQRRFNRCPAIDTQYP
jgi:G3E family GTPase